MEKDATSTSTPTPTLSEPGVEWPLPLGPYPPMELGDRRLGTSPLEQAALARTEACIASLRAVDLVRLCLWPEKLPDVARAAGRAPATLHNTLTFMLKRPNRPSRLLLARKLGLAVSEIDYAIETPRAPIPRRGEPARPTSGTRAGTGALELMTLRRVGENLAAFSPGVVLQMIIWPFSETELAQAIEVPNERLYQSIAALRGPFRSVRERVASFMEVDVALLDHLLDAEAGDATLVTGEKVPRAEVRSSH